MAMPKKVTAGTTAAAQPAAASAKKEAPAAAAGKGNKTEQGKAASGTAAGAKGAEATVVDATAANNLPAVNTGTPPAVSDAPYIPDEFCEDAGAGMSQMTAEDMAIPIIAILQAMSPVATRGHAKYVIGAEAGMFFNSATGEVTNDIRVVVCHFEPVVLEYVPRNAGGGFRGRHAITAPILRTAKRGVNEDKPNLVTLPNGNELQRTNQYYVLIITEDEDGKIQCERALLGLASTNLKISKRWNSKCAARVLKHPGTGKSFCPPLFSYIHDIETELVSNSKGNWYAPKIDGGTMNGTMLDLTDPDQKRIYEEARAFWKSISAGEVKIKEPEPDVEGDGAMEAEFAEEGEGEFVEGQKLPF